MPHLCDSSPHVASRAHKSGHQACAPLGHKGHHSKGQTARLLAEDGEDHQDGHGCSQALTGQAHQQTEETAKGLDSPPEKIDQSVGHGDRDQHPNVHVHGVVCMVLSVCWHDKSCHGCLSQIDVTVLEKRR